MVDRDKALDRARISRDPSDWTTFRILRNKCTSMQKKDRNNYLKDTYDKMEAEHDSAKLFSTTRSLLGWQRAGPPSSFNIDGRYVTKQFDIAEAQATFYQDKVNKIKASLPKVNIDTIKYIRKAFLRWLPAGGRPTFKLRTVTISDVHTMIKALKISHAYGHDEVDSSIIKLAAPVLVPVITHIVNLSLETSTFPQKWKLARVLPLLKSSDADKHTPGSFRPIAQLEARGTHSPDTTPTLS